MAGGVNELDSEGVGSTVIIVVAVSVLVLYVIVTVPAFIPVTMPDAEPIVAIEVVPDVHEPPGVASVNVIAFPVQTWPGPVIGDMASDMSDWPSASMKNNNRFIRVTII
jgi:hypothetical protein